MTALPLSPQSNNYLTDTLVYQQITQNYVSPTLADGVTANQEPKLILDGCGRAYLTGSVSVGAVITAGDTLMTLPSYITIPHGYAVNASTLTAGAYGNTILSISSPSGGITAINFSALGSYATMPTTVLSGPGEDAVLVNHMQVLSATPVGNPTGNTSYAPGENITLAGGTFSTAGILPVATTGVYSAAVAAGGSGGTDGTQTVTGTTGTGTKFTASVTISGGAITAVNSITTSGSYTVNPTSLAAEPVTGASLTGATLTVRMKPLTFGTIVTAGNYEALPTSPVAQGSSSGTGTGMTFTVLWKFLNIEITNPGTGYTSASTVSFTGGGSTGGAVATVTAAAASNSVTVKLGKNVTTNDAVILDGIVFFVNSY